MSGPLRLSFVESATRSGTLPHSPAEVAFVGRSNVGKSSLINALANRKQLARVMRSVRAMPEVLGVSRTCT